MGNEGSDQSNVNCRATGIGCREPYLSERAAVFFRPSKCATTIFPFASAGHTLSGGRLVCVGILSGGSERSLFDTPSRGIQHLRNCRAGHALAARKASVRNRGRTARG